MTDTGVWKLKCPDCDHVFELELVGAASIVALSRESPCPSCKQIPSASGNKRENNFHKVIGFTTSKKPR